jgi:hypothetical protein
MNKTLVVILQLVLIVAYLGSVFFVYDSSTGMGLAQIGGTSAVVLILVLVLEKKKDKPVDASEAAPATEAPVEQPAEPVAEVPAQEAVQEPVAEAPAQEQPPT